MPTERARLTIEGIARDVRGVLDVRNELESADALAAARPALDEALRGRVGQPPASAGNR